MQRGEVLHRDAAVWCALPCYVFQYLGHHRLCSVASWALWRFVFRCPVAVRSMSLSDVFPFWRKSVPNSLKQILWAIWGGPDWGPIRRRKAFPCCVTFVFFCAEAFSYSVALVFGFLTFAWGVQHGLSGGVRNMYKTNVFLHILKTNRKRMARQKRRRKTKIFKINWKNEYF